MSVKQDLAQIELICQKYNRNNDPGFLLGIVKNQDLIFCKGYGLANLEHQIPIGPQTVFHGCSLAKQFTAACIALLIEEGKLTAEQDIRTYFPQVNDSGDPITILNLLQMTNGLPDVYETASAVCGIHEDEAISRAEFWRYLTACDWRLFKSGERWSYGNSGYFLLGQLVEKLTNLSLSQFADEQIFQPLGMSHTLIRDDHTKIIKNKAAGYSNYSRMHANDHRKPYCSRNDFYSLNEEVVEVGGAGQIWTTVEDFLRWDQNFYHNILGKGSQSLVDFLTSSGKLNNGALTGYGCGLFIGEFAGRKIIHHGGSAGGYSAYYIQIPELKTSVITLGNHSDFVYEMDIGFKNNNLLERVLRLLLGQNSEKPENQSRMVGFDSTDPGSSSQHSAEKASDAAWLADVKEDRFMQPWLEYRGTYRCPALETAYQVEPMQNNLVVSNLNRHDTASDLTYLSLEQDLFLCLPNACRSDVYLKFNRDQEGRIIAFTYQSSRDTTAASFLFVKQV